MRILALETSSRSGSVAVLEDERLLHEAQLRSDQRTAQSLAPGIATALEEVGWDAADVELIAVTVGPGSFTGLRVGVTTAKTFAYAVGCQVLGVNTLEVVAAQVPADVSEVFTVVDAHREQLFVGHYRPQQGSSVETVTPAAVVDIEPWLADLKPGDTLSGPGLSKLGDRLPSDVRVVDPAMWPPTAATVGALAWRKHCNGQRDDVWKLAPLYSRQSAAEEKWQQRNEPR